ncbi:hypothetical protein GOBAR_AA01042 [Gossypium barbadense]|uniref:RING-type E3 ubiquitin transferase n=1 Tax=Gossypium barbadense TaxID=3634 RepID=A0A2P5YV80_GOSBA|nr:hypothetical protein GOBAR_AA01042 [Gossypium barbadense]
MVQYQNKLPQLRKIASFLVPASDPKYGMRLTWHEPDCTSCEHSGGNCMFKSDIGALGLCYNSEGSLNNYYKGLDGPSIDAYPVILLSETRQLPRPSDNICSTCLWEYQDNEKLSTIPNCEHCFHALCINEWLKLKCHNIPSIL